MTTPVRHPSMGKMFRDPITGFEGTCISRCEYLSGCFHLELQRGDPKTKKPESEWFDEERVEELPDAKEHKDTKRKRSPGNTPPPFSHP